MRGARTVTPTTRYWNRRRHAEVAIQRLCGPVGRLPTAITKLVRIPRRASHLPASELPGIGIFHPPFPVATLPRCDSSPAFLQKQRGRVFNPASLPHSTLRTKSSMLRRRHYAFSHTRSEYCVFTSSTLLLYPPVGLPPVTSSGDKPGRSDARREIRGPGALRHQGALFSGFDSLFRGDLLQQ